MHLNSASNRSAAVSDDFKNTETSVKQTVDLSRRRGVAWKKSNSLTGGDESIRAEGALRLTRGAVQIGIRHLIATAHEDLSIRPDLHFLYNLIETAPLALAFFWQVRQTTTNAVGARRAGASRDVAARQRAAVIRSRSAN